MVAQATISSKSLQEVVNSVAAVIFSQPAVWSAEPMVASASQAIVARARRFRANLSQQVSVVPTQAVEPVVKRFCAQVVRKARSSWAWAELPLSKRCNITTLVAVGKLVR